MAALKLMKAEGFSQSLDMVLEIVRKPVEPRVAFNGDRLGFIGCKHLAQDLRTTLLAWPVHVMG